VTRCSKCGFPLGARPGSIDKGEVCQACLNNEAKKDIDFAERQKWLTKYIADNKTHPKYDCVVAVSGGKDSHMIVRRLVEHHGVKNALLVSVTDEFTHTEAGKRNIDNLVTRFNFDHITFRCEPKTFKAETYKDFVNELHPLKWIEEKIYKIPVEIAKAYGIKLVFFGENSAFEYGTSEELAIFHPVSYEAGEGYEKHLNSTLRNLRDDVQVIFMGAIWPYSITDSLQQAQEIGFIGLNDTGEWDRQGSIDQFTQIDSVAYMIQLWTKWPKYKFQRVADIACRFVREGILSRDEAIKLIEAKDHICDPRAKKDFCDTIGITQGRFDEVVKEHTAR
jgi:predicted PP-loop superfamily ATPase